MGPIISQAERDARDYVQARLGLLSLVLWFLVAFGLTVALYSGRSPRASALLLVGMAALAVAALPWLTYPGWKARVRRRLEARRGPRPPVANGVARR